MESDFIWMDGEMVPYDQATVHILTPTLHYGVGVFEGIRCYLTPRGPTVFRLRDHLKRFVESIHILGVKEYPFSVDDLERGVQDTIRKNGFQECYIRPFMYLKGPMGMNMDLSRPGTAIAAWEWGPYLGEESKTTGIHMMVASYTRLHPNILMTKAKISGNYVNSLMVKTLALRSGYDEAVILDPQGFVAECTGENIFMVRRGKLVSPPLSIVLEGITRDSVITLAIDLGISFEEMEITRDQLYIADELFITGTAAEIVGVRMVDFRSVGNGKVGPITQKISQAYKEVIHGRGFRAEEWLNYQN